MPDANLERLTPKERECLRLVHENRSSKEIARRLGISPTSVNTHIRRALAKLDLHDRYEAARQLERLEREDPPPDAPAATAAAGGWTDVVAQRRGLPPLESLSLWRRLALVGAAAMFMALVFGMVLTAMRAL